MATPIKTDKTLLPNSTVVLRERSNDYGKLNNAGYYFTVVVVLPNYVMLRSINKPGQFLTLPISDRGVYALFTVK